jgi:hypothetical protein
MLAPPTHVFTHSEPAPNPLQFESNVQPKLKQVTVDGHGHGPLNRYGPVLTASTVSTRSLAPTSSFGSVRLGRKWVIAFTRAIGKFLTLLTIWARSFVSGCTKVDGGLNVGPTSHQRRVNIVTGAETLVQSVSAPLHDAPYVCTLYSELGAISAPTTVIGLIAVSVTQSW